MDPSQRATKQEASSAGFLLNATGRDQRSVCIFFIFVMTLQGVGQESFYDTLHGRDAPVSALASHRLHVAINLSPAPPEPLGVKMIFQRWAANVAPAGAASVGERFPQNSWA